MFSKENWSSLAIFYLHFFVHKHICMRQIVCVCPHAQNSSTHEGKLHGFVRSRAQTFWGDMISRGQSCICAREISMISRKREHEPIHGQDHLKSDKLFWSTACIALIIPTIRNPILSVGPAENVTTMAQLVWHRHWRLPVDWFRLRCGILLKQHILIIFFLHDG